jgi:hypothetical protein
MKTTLGEWCTTMYANKAVQKWATNLEVPLASVYTPMAEAGAGASLPIQARHHRSVNSQPGRTCIYLRFRNYTSLPLQELFCMEKPPPTTTISF